MANTTKRLVGVIFFVIVTAILYFKSGRQNADEVKRINEFFDSFKAEGGAPLPQAVGKASVAGTYNLELVPMDGKLRSADGGSVAYALMQPPFDSSHGSNIIRMPGTGDLLVTWFSGEEEGGDGVAIVVARLENGASSWSTPKVVSRKSMRSAQNPVLWYDPRAGVLHLYHTSQEAFMGQATSVVLRLSSTDGGDTWSEPSVLFDEPGAFLRNQVISSHDGSEFLLPMVSERVPRIAAMTSRADTRTPWPPHSTTHRMVSSRTSRNILQSYEAAMVAPIGTPCIRSRQGGVCSRASFAWAHPSTSSPTSAAAPQIPSTFLQVWMTG